MNILFRVDASLKIGSGHVMRCLALAKQLRLNDANILFICREHEGHMGSIIESEGFKCLLLPTNSDIDLTKIEQQKLELESYKRNEYLSWLNCSLEKDAQQTIKEAEKFAIENLQVEQYDWIVCDHYALDKTWHKKLRKITKKIFVIDDLANRELDCDLLLDQTFLCKQDKYKSVIDITIKQLLGTDYALLGTEYLKLRTSELMLKRKSNRLPSRILIFMGGSDKANWTMKVLNQLEIFNIETEQLIGTSLDVIIGPQYQYVKELNQVIDKISIRTNLLKNVKNMAELISTADLAIGAGGGSSWERCCLAMPTLTCIVAENQRELTLQLETYGAILKWESESELLENIKNIYRKPSQLTKISKAASKVCDGLGVKRVCKILLDIN